MGRVAGKELDRVKLAEHTPVSPVLGVALAVISRTRRAEDTEGSIMSIVLPAVSGSKVVLCVGAALLIAQGVAAQVPLTVLAASGRGIAGIPNSQAQVRFTAPVVGVNGTIAFGTTSNPSYDPATAGVLVRGTGSSLAYASAVNLPGGQTATWTLRQVPFVGENGEVVGMGSVSGAGSAGGSGFVRLDGNQLTMTRDNSLLNAVGGLVAASSALLAYNNGRGVITGIPQGSPGTSMTPWRVRIEAASQALVDAPGERLIIDGAFASINREGEYTHSTVLDTQLIWSANPQHLSGDSTVATPGLYFARSSPVSINTQGVGVFYGTQQVAGLWRMTRGESVTPIVTYSVSIATTDWPVINDRGSILAMPYLAAGRVPVFYPGGSAQSVVDVNAFTALLGTSLQNVTFTNGELGPLLNNRDQWVMPVRTNFSNNSITMIGYDPYAGLFRIAAVGQSVEIAPGIWRTISGLTMWGGSGNADGRRSALSDDGLFAFRATFTDGTEAVLSTRLPSPGGLCLLALGGIWASRRRRVGVA